MHRRAFYDDHWGVEEALDEPGESGKGLVARGIHWMIVDTPNASPRIHRSLAFELFNSPLLSFAPLQSSIEQYQAAFNTVVSELHKSFILPLLDLNSFKTEYELRGNFLLNLIFP